MSPVHSRSLAPSSNDDMSHGRYLFTSIMCPKCEIVKAWMADHGVTGVEVRNITADPDNLALAAFLEVGMEVPVLYDDGEVVVGANAIITHWSSCPVAMD